MFWLQVISSWLLADSLVAIAVAEKPILYYIPASPPCRMVMMTSKLLGIDLDMRLLDVVKGEQFTPEYLQINPQHTVPALDDNGFKISESRAIAAYLTTLAPDGDKLYPNDPKKKALVDQIMYFDLDKVYKRVLDRFVFDVNATPMVAGAPYTKVKGDLLDSAFRTLELYIARGPWFAGDAMTIADVAILTSVSLAEGCGYDVSKFPKLNTWYMKIKTMIPEYHELNEVGMQMWLNASIARRGQNKRKRN